jgi:hypothetical protein
MPVEKRLSSSNRNINDNNNKPLGLGSKKKARSEEALPEAEKEEKGLYFELDADADQFDELKAMFDTAEATLDDPAKCIPLLRGIVHECTSLYKVGDSEHNSQFDSADETAEEDQGKKFPATFYRIFGDSLFNLAIMENTPDLTEGEISNINDKNKQIFQQRGDFLKAALDKIEEGIDCYPRNYDLIESKVIIIASLAVNGDDYYSLKFAPSLTDCLNELKDRGDSGKEAMIDLFNKVFQIRLEASSPAKSKKLIEGLLSVFEDFLGDDVEEESNVQILKLSLINSLAEMKMELEEDSQEVNSFLSKIIEKGEDHLLSKKNSTEDLKGQLISALGESYMLLSSVKAIQGEEDGEIFYSQKAIEKFELARDEFGVELDEAIEEFIKDVKSTESS